MNELRCINVFNKNKKKVVRAFFSNYSCYCLVKIFFGNNDISFNFSR